LSIPNWQDLSECSTEQKKLEQGLADTAEIVSFLRPFVEQQLAEENARLQTLRAELEEYARVREVVCMLRDWTWIAYKHRSDAEGGRKLGTDQSESRHRVHREHFPKGVGNF
jgi:hypothetical protein